MFTDKIKKLASATAEMFNLLLILTFPHHQKLHMDTATTGFTLDHHLVSILPGEFIVFFFDYSESPAELWESVVWYVCKLQM